MWFIRPFFEYQILLEVLCLLAGILTVVIVCIGVVFKEMKDLVKGARKEWRDVMVMLLLIVLVSALITDFILFMF